MSYGFEKKVEEDRKNSVCTIDWVHGFVCEKMEVNFCCCVWERDG